MWRNLDILVSEPASSVRKSISPFWSIRGESSLVQGCITVFHSASSFYERYFATLYPSVDVFRTSEIRRGSFLNSWFIIPALSQTSCLHIENEDHVRYKNIEFIRSIASSFLHHHGRRGDSWVMMTKYGISACGYLLSCGAMLWRDEPFHGSDGLERTIRDVSCWSSKLEMHVKAVECHYRSLRFLCKKIQSHRLDRFERESIVEFQRMQQPSFILRHRFRRVLPPLRACLSVDVFRTSESVMVILCLNWRRHSELRERETENQISDFYSIESTKTERDRRQIFKNFDNVIKIIFTEILCHGLLWSLYRLNHGT